MLFCTQAGGETPRADPLLLEGVIFGRLGAERQACAYYRELECDDAFRTPFSWDEIDFADYDGLLLAGGHAPGMRQYLGSSRVHEQIGAFFALDRPVGAICHGVLAAARSLDRSTGRSVLYDRKTTCLPKYQELLAYVVTRWKLGRYYRTYPKYVQDEVEDSLRDAATQFKRGPMTLTTRDSETDSGPAFVVEDGNYVSARWPGDAYTFARKFQRLLGAADRAREKPVEASGAPVLP